MSDIIGRIGSLSHRPYRQGFDHILFGFVFYFGHQVIHRRSKGFAATCFQSIPEFSHKTVEFFQLFRQRFFVNTVYESRCFFPTLGFTDPFGHFLIRKQHKLFDQLIGFLRTLEIHTHRMSLFIQVEFHLYPVEIDRSGFKAILT